MSRTPTYDEAMASLSGLIPELFVAPPQNGAPPTRRKFSLDEIRLLSAALGNPHQKFPSILIAGTNGKGSTAATLASIARASGLRVGLYTSPHLERVNERIRLLTPAQENPGAPYLPSSSRQMWGEDIPDATFAALYFRVHDTAQQLVLDGTLSHLPSYFELLTTLAFLYFAEPTPGSSPVDLAVLEVGMGGRLDATNLVDPVLSVITDISLDHQEWLGNTIAEITREKAGILRPHGTLVTLPQHPEANQALGEVAIAARSPRRPRHRLHARCSTHLASTGPYSNRSPRPANPRRLPPPRRPPAPQHRPGHRRRRRTQHRPALPAPPHHPGLHRPRHPHHLLARPPRTPHPAIAFPSGRSGL